MECENLVAALRSCSKLAAQEDGKKTSIFLEKGMAIHSQARQYLHCILLQNALLDLYVKCGAMSDAVRLFSTAAMRDVASWNILMLAYARNGDGDSSLEMFVAMVSEGYVPDAWTYVAAIKACVSLAQREEAIELREHHRGGSSAKIKATSLEKGMSLHALALKSGFSRERFVVSGLIDMYAKCGDMKSVEWIFADHSLHSNVVAWNSIIQGYVDNEILDRALEAFQTMKNSKRCSPDARSFVSALKACSKLASSEEFLELDRVLCKARALERGMVLHSEAIQSKVHFDPYVVVCLIDLYASCGVMEEARRFFDAVSMHSLVSWTALINGYADNGEFDFALELFSFMISRNFRPNSYTYVAAAKACSGLASKESAIDSSNIVKVRSLEKTMALHSRAAPTSSSWNVYLASSLIDAYAKCGCMEMAQWIFDNARVSSIFLWNSMISGYSEIPGSISGRRALEIFELLIQSQACFPDSWTFAAAAKACTALAIDEDLASFPGDAYGLKFKIETLELAMAIHSRADEHCEDGYVASALVELYSKCGTMVDAKRVFDRCRVRHPVICIGLISGYCDNKQGESALATVSLMRSKGCITKNSWTLLTALKASKNSEDLRTGRVMHAEVCRYGFEEDPAMATQLVDFYVKCGTMVDAEQVFSSIKEPKVSSWTALISGYSVGRDSRLAFDRFDQMLYEEFKPDSITIVAILAACSHAGLVDKGLYIFNAIRSKFGLVPTLEHFHCLADLLSRANRADQAIEILQTMPCKADAVTWIVAMEACKKWKNVDIANQAFKELIKFEDNAANYMALSNTLQQH